MIIQDYKFRLDIGLIPMRYKYNKSEVNNEQIVKFIIVRHSKI